MMSATAEQFATRVPAGWSGLCALQSVAALSAGTLSVQREGAGGAWPGVADELAGVVAT